MFLPIKLSHFPALCVCVCVLCKNYQAHSIWQPEIDLNKKARENKEVSVLYGDTQKKKGARKARARREGSLCLLCMHGELLREKELTGRRSAASSSQTTAAQNEETSWGWCDMSPSFSISLFTCLLLLLLSKQIHARHMRYMLPPLLFNKQLLFREAHIHSWDS